MCNVHEGPDQEQSEHRACEGSIEQRLMLSMVAYDACWASRNGQSLWSAHQCAGHDHDAYVLVQSTLAKSNPESIHPQSLCDAG